MLFCALCVLFPLKVALYFLLLYSYCIYTLPFFTKHKDVASLKIICFVFILIGSIIMTLNIIKYAKSVGQLRAIHTDPRFRALHTYYITIGLMSFFLLGYLCTLIFILLSSVITMQDFIIAAVFLFGAVFVDIMITSQKNMTSLHAKEVLRTITDNVSTLICVVDDKTQEVMFVNQAMARYLGKDVPEIIGKTCWKILHPEQKSSCEACPFINIKTQSLALNKPYYWEYESCHSENCFLVTSSYVSWVDNRRVQLHSFVDISERKKYEKNLQICASTDRLTSAYNRTWGHQLLEGVFNATTPKKPPITICFLDIDKLKYINDTHGHEAGDTLLCEFVALIKKTIRQQDVVIRWGGDEFVLLLHCGENDAKKVIDKIRAAADTANETASRPYPLLFSCGFEEITNFSETTLEKAIANADQKMYEHKLHHKKH